MIIRSIHINDFRQFSNVEIKLGRRITAIAGNNGTGKSTILGLLANSSELPAVYKTYLGKRYRSEFSELFAASPKYDLSGSDRARITFERHGSGGSKNSITTEEVSFRTAWQGKKTRFRIIPRRKNEQGKMVSSKMPSPIIYLGLSRLYPLGEADDKAVSSRTQKWKDSADENWFKNNYTSILSMDDSIDSVSSLGIKGLARKRGMGVGTDLYGPTTNSSGQDNLGQILMAILSFKSLKRELGDDWDGGQLIIDELDATLHPAAQERLIKLLLKECKSTGFQAVFTTHSTVLLKQLSDMNQRNPNDSPGDIEVAYLTNGNGRLEVKRNPSWSFINNDLLIRSANQHIPKVGVFTEDAEARWLASRLLKEKCPDILDNVNFIDASIGCGQLMQLYSQDYPYLRDRIVVFDGDVSKSKLEEYIPLDDIQRGANIVRLPGKGADSEVGKGERPESVICDYLESLIKSDSPVISILERQYDLTLRNIVKDNGPLSSKYDNENSPRNKYKEWFRANKAVFDGIDIVHYWVEDNPKETEEFIASFTRAYNAVAKRTSAREISVAVLKVLNVS